MDSLMASFMIKAVATTTLTQAKLFLAIAEDTVFYDAPNGEQQFYDVFRKAFTSYEGNLVQLPVVGDSITIDFVGPVNSEWNMDRLEVIGILQDQDTRKVIQAAITPDTEDYSSVPHLHYPKLSRIIMSPNPAGDFLILEKISGLVEIFSMNGKCLVSYEFGDSSKEIRVDISNIPGGNYIVRNGSTSSNLVIVR